MPAAATAARLSWYPSCSHSSPAGALTWACPLHDPLLQADCAGCGEREQRRAGELLAAREIRRAREIAHQEEIEMPKAGSGFWSGMHVGEDGKSMPRLELARRMRAEGMKIPKIAAALGGSESSLYAILAAEAKFAEKPLRPQPKAEQAPTPAAERVSEPELAAAPAAAPDDEPEPVPAVDEIEQVAQQAEQTAAGILQVFAESEAAEVMALVFEFLEYRGLQAECELFIRFGLWRSRRQAG